MGWKRAGVIWFFLAWFIAAPAVAADIDSHALWQAGVAQSAEQLLLGKHQEAGIEQEIEIAASADAVMAVLADIQNYTDLYPLFDVIELHKVYQTEELDIISEFTAIDREFFGAFVSEEQYFSVAVINYDKRQVDLNIWQLDQVFINIRMVVQPNGRNARVNLYTHIQAEKGTLSQMLLNELDRPVLRLDLLKQLLERGFIAEDRQCTSSRSGENRYCF